MLTMPTVIVVGAGCFGGWTAYWLARAGCRVALLDAYGPGNSRSSSGGETRIIRMGYGDKEIYTRWSWRSLGLWKSLFDRTARPLFHETGVLWMAREQDPLSSATLATLEHVGVPHERLTRQRLESRWPQIDFGPVAWAIYEPGSGVLMARRAVEAVVREAVRAGVHYAAAAAEPAFARTVPKASFGAAGSRIDGGRLEAVTTRSGQTIDGDTFVFACGPWLPKLFPDLLGDRIFTTRQEVIYIGPPAGNEQFAPLALPAWIDFSEEMYGIPDIEGRGFKISLDRHGPPFDPDTGDRVAGETFTSVRAYLARRFPALGTAPILAAEVCQYENTCNGDFLIDRHSALENVWLVGGGSGHGFKHGPAVGEYVARLITEGGTPDERFQLVTKENVHKRAVF